MMSILSKPAMLRDMADVPHISWGDFDLALTNPGVMTDISFNIQYWSIVESNIIFFFGYIVRGCSKIVTNIFSIKSGNNEIIKAFDYIYFDLPDSQLKSDMRNLGNCLRRIYKTRNIFRHEIIGIPSIPIGGIFFAMPASIAQLHLIDIGSEQKFVGDITLTNKQQKNVNLQNIDSQVFSDSFRALSTRIDNAVFLPFSVIDEITQASGLLSQFIRFFLLNAVEPAKISLDFLEIMRINLRKIENLSLSMNDLKRS